MPEIKNESKIPSNQILVGKYRVLREIGRGGMAAVYEAEHLALGKKVAVKVLAAELAASTIVIERFFREARAAASVKSPYIVEIYDSGRLEDGRPFITMEMLEGETLYDRMTRIRLIDPETTVKIITQCAKGLMKAHAVGIVHRDLKPENIFLVKSDDGDELVKLLDFGLAKFYAPVKPDEKAARLTREGAVFGTPAYMSPEQVKGIGSVDHRADLWALGCMTFECLTGRPVWNTDQGVAMTFAAIATGNLPVASRLRPELPPAFDEWFKKALERDPNRRFQTSKELADALARSFGGGPISIISAQDLDAADTIATKGPPFLPDDDEMPTVAQRSIPISLGSASEMTPRIPDAKASTGKLLLAPPREQGMSATELPATASSAGGMVPMSRATIARWAISGTALLATLIGALLTWIKVLSPQVFTPLVLSSAAVSTPEGPASSGVDPLALPVEEPKWSLALDEGQRLFSSGDAAGAQKKFKEALDLGANAGLARSFLEQTRAAQTGPCKMVAFSHPRLGVASGASRPSVASGAKGAVVGWIDDHEQSGRDHVYSVVIDATGKPASRPRDLTPEATDVTRGSLLAVGDRMVLVYGDKSGREAGVHVRWIDEDGRIGGPSVLVSGARPGNYSPALERAPDGFFVAWDDERNRDGADLYLRHLGQDLDVIGPEIRATDYVGPPGHGPAARVPAVAIGSNVLYVAYKLERDAKTHLIERMRLPLGSVELTTGLDNKPPPRGTPRRDRELGDVQLINEDKAPSDAPAIACGSEGCFLAWAGEPMGAYAALIDPVEGKVLWRKKFADKGAHPTLAVSADGQVVVGYFEGGRVRMAMLTRDGFGAPSAFARVTGDQPRPWIATGRAKGEWFVAWQDAETTHTEAYVARVVCKM